jgi:hypothetical protein
VLGDGCEIELTARAYDAAGAPIEAPLTWSVRYADDNDPTKTGGGHQLIVHHRNQATFVGGGIAPGVFPVLAADETCNIGDEKHPQYVTGQSWIKVNQPPGVEAICGPLLVTYGDRIDRRGDKEILASNKVTLLAEVSSNQKLLRSRHRARFIVNNKPYAGTRPFYLDAQVVILEGMPRGYMAFLPLYLAPGEYKVRYELVVDGQVVCGSRTERFWAR